MKTPFANQKRREMFRKVRLWLFSMVMVFSAQSAIAETLELSAVFKPEPADFTSDKFKDVTPDTGFCSSTTLVFIVCASDERSLNTRITGFKHLDVLNDHLLENAMSATVDGRLRTVKLVGEKGGEIEAQLRISLFGWRTTINDANYSGASLGGSNGAYTATPGPCVTRGGGGSALIATRVWFIPREKVTCQSVPVASRPIKLNDDVDLKDIQIGYELIIQDPRVALTAANGNYYGETVYTVGDGGDIDLHALRMDDSELKLKINAFIDHYFSVRFPDTINNLTLSPKGGWAPWLNGGRVPQMLSNEVPFSVNSSTSFQVSMQCGFTAGNTCGLQNTQNSLVVPLDVRVTMPAFTRPNGQGINKLLLTTQRETFVPSRTFVIDSLSKIHFSVGQQGVKTMTEWPGSTWKGTVSVIFDTELE